MTHVRTDFSFRVDAPYAVVAPLFGAHEERRWAPDWAPRFIHPQPVADIEGAVFVVDNDPPMVWINTIFDLAAGRVQYANFANGSLVTRIDIAIEGRAPASTEVRVSYERTSLDPSADDQLPHLAAADRKKAEEWASEIRACLQSQPAID
jgi:hypothetical protein